MIPSFISGHRSGSKRVLLKVACNPRNQSNTPASITPMMECLGFFFAYR
jgi:hypothetical protein